MDELEPQREVASALTLSWRAVTAVGNGGAESQPQSVTRLGGVGEELHFCAPWRPWRLGQREAMRERESKPRELPRPHTGKPQCDALWVIKPGIYENKFMLHLMHCGRGWLPEAQTGGHIVADNRNRCHLSENSRDKASRR